MILGTRGVLLKSKQVISTCWEPSSGSLTPFTWSKLHQNGFPCLTSALSRATMWPTHRALNKGSGQGGWKSHSPLSWACHCRLYLQLWVVFLICTKAPRDRGSAVSPSSSLSLFLDCNGYNREEQIWLHTGAVSLPLVYCCIAIKLRMLSIPQNIQDSLFSRLWPLEV